VQEERGRQSNPNSNSRISGFKDSAREPQKWKKKTNWKGLLLGNGKRVMGIAYWALVLWYWGRCEADKDAQTFGARLTNPN